MPIYFSAAKTVAPNTITAAMSRSNCASSFSVYQFFPFCQCHLLLFRFFFFLIPPLLDSAEFSIISKVSFTRLSTHSGTSVSSEKHQTILSSMNISSFILCTKLFFWLWRALQSTVFWLISRRAAISFTLRDLL